MKIKDYTMLLNIVALFGFAIAQPIYSIFSQDAEVFVAQQNSTCDD